MSKRVVIIGGGVSSNHAAQEILKKGKKDVDVTIVQACRFVEWPLAMTVCLVRPDLHDKAIATNMNKYQIPGVTYKYGVVESVSLADKKLKIVGSDDTIPYDALIVATGFRMPLVYPEPGATYEERKKEVQQVGDAVKKGNCIVVAGGGPVGLELAGDIRGEYPDKNVILLCKNGVLSQWPEKMRRKVEAQLAKMNITVMNGALDAPSDPKLEAGIIRIGEKDLPIRELAYDVFLPAYSQGPNTKFLPKSVLDNKGFIDVNEYLQSKSNTELFALGTSNVNEPFVGMVKLEGQWGSIASNLVAMFAGKPLKKHEEAMKFMKLPPAVTIGHGPTGYSFFDFDNMPPPVKCCCCCGLGGFPCWPPCWPCCACGGCGCCPCGLCCGPPEGKGPSTFLGKMAFMSAGFHFKGVGEKPQQQVMVAATE